MREGGDVRVRIRGEVKDDKGVTHEVREGNDDQTKLTAKSFKTSSQHPPYINPLLYLVGNEWSKHEP